MAEPMESDRVPRVSVWPRVALGLLLFGIMITGGMRLNNCDLFNPDSPRYLLYAQGMAETGDYRAIDSPGAPLYTWRPPGLPLLLVPVLWIFPYSVVAAKCVVLLCAVVLLAGLAALTTRVSSAWAGVLVVAIVGTSPLFLTLATEVLSEVPYTLGTLLAILVLARGAGAEPLKLAPWIGLGLALALTPAIRTVGVSLLVAVGLETVFQRRRWNILLAVAGGVAVLGWLAWRSHGAPGSNYAGSLFKTWQDHGLGRVITDALQTLAFYGSTVPGVLLPGLVPGQPFWAPLVPGTLPAVEGWSVPVTVAAWLLVVAGLAGMWRQRILGGRVALLYVGLYVGCLAIWPWRHERFLWPLVPLVLAYSPAGFAWASLRRAGLNHDHAAMGSVLPRGVRGGIAVAGLALVAWQLIGVAALVGVNQRFLADQDGFFRDEAPGFYFSDWRGAGDWIRENTDPAARILTWQAATAGTAHRFQKRLQFEALSPAAVREQIAGFSARYLVVTTAQFGTGFGWQQAWADPAMSLRVVYQNRDVAVLEVEPNRSGTVSRTAYRDWLKSQLTAVEEFLLRSPGRSDLVVRQADLLRELGQTAPAIELLENLVRRGMVTVRVCSTLGWLHLSDGDLARAAELLELASGLPNAEPIAAALRDGASRARQRLVEPKNSATVTRDRAVKRAQGLVETLRFVEAQDLLDIELKAAPDHGDLNYWRGYVHHIFGEHDAAVSCYERALRKGSEPAREKLRLLQLEHRVNLSAGNSVQAQERETLVELASLYEEHGWGGRAVAVLESARQRFGDAPQILVPLGTLYLKFARPDLAVSLLELVPEDSPHFENVAPLLANARSALRQPRY